MILLFNLMNQALSYIMLIVVSMLVVGPLVFHAQSTITSNVMSYQDFIELQNKRVAQQVAITHVQHDDATEEIHIHIVNTGIEDMAFNHILINGIPLNPDTTSDPCWDPNNPKSGPKGYCFYDSTSGANLKNPDATVPVNGNIRLGITYQPGILFPPPDENKIQLVTDAFKLFEISLP